MPRSVLDIVRSRCAELEQFYQGGVPWGTKPSHAAPGIYIVSLSADPQSLGGRLERCPVNMQALTRWLQLRPELRLGGTRPSVEVLASFVARWWVPDENVLYIGYTRATLATRVWSYHKTPLGAAKPHAGGMLIKTLSCLADLHVHLFVGQIAPEFEHMALLGFREGLSDQTIQRLPDPMQQLPFANGMWPNSPQSTKGPELTRHTGPVPARS